MGTNTWAGGDSGNETDWNTAANWSGGVPDATDDVVIPNVTHDPVIGSGLNPTINSLKIEDGGNLDGNGNTITIDDKDGSSYSIYVVPTATITGTLNIKVTGNGGYIREQGTGSINNLEVDLGSSSDVHYLDIDLSIANNLTITEGIFNTNASSNRALTVGKQISIASGATLNCNASTITNGSASSNASDFDPAGNLTLGSCTFKFFCGSSGNIYLSDATLASNTSTLEIIGMQTFSNRDMGLSASSGNLHNLTVTKTGSVTSGFRLTHNTTLGGNLTIETGATLDTNTSNKSLTVAGATKVTGTLTGNDSTLIFGTDGVHTPVEAGSLWVESAGSFTFGSGDVTIFGGITAKGTEASPNITSTGGGDIIIKGRTNNGFMNSHGHHGVNITGDYIIDYDTTAIFDNRGGITIACNTFIIKHDGRTYEPWSNSGQDLFKIVGNMSITQGTFDTEYSGQDSQKLEVTGDVTIGDGSGSANTAAITGNTSPSISFGSLVIDSDGKYEQAGGVTTINGGFHNNGTFTPSEGVIEMGGTGSVVNALPPKLTINNDSALYLDGTGDAVVAAHSTDWNPGTGDFSVSYWVDMDSGTSEQHVVCKRNSGSPYDGYVFGFLSGKPRYFLRGAGTEGGEVDVSGATDMRGKGWVHYTFTRDGNVVKTYINGVLVTGTNGTYTYGTTGGTALTTAINPTSGSPNFTIGAKDSGAAQNFTGHIADVRYYSDILTDSEILQLASKINVTGVTGNLVGHWKLNDGTGTPAGSGSTAGSMSVAGGPTWKTDQFTTTLLPTMTEVDSLEVSSGVLDLDNRNYIDLDGASDYVNTSWEFATLMGQPFTWSGWFKPADGQPAAEEYLMGLEKDSNNNWDIAIETDGQIKANYKAGGTAVASTTVTALANGQEGWHHFVWVISATSNDLYLNGVLEDATSHSITLSNYANSDQELWFGNRNHSSNNPFTGSIRDFRLYDYALSAEQAKSVYLGRYTPTPAHWWKMNEGTGATATIEDYGTGTDRDGTGVSLTWAGTDNFKVNGSARIGTNGSI